MKIPEVKGTLIQVSFNIASSTCYIYPSYKMTIKPALHTEVGLPEPQVSATLLVTLSEEAILNLAWECTKAVAFRDRMEVWENENRKEGTGKAGEKMIDELVKKLREEAEQKEFTKKRLFSRFLDIIRRRR